MRIFGIFCAGLIVFVFSGLFAFAVALEVWGSWHDEWSGYNASVQLSDGTCNVAVIPIVGDISTMGAITTDEEGNDHAYTNADDAVALIEEAESDPSIKGVMVRIDSSGGYPVASEIIATALKKSPLPTAALIRESGTSGGYLVATGADTIIASPFSDVGSIGITMSYVGNWKQNETEGLTYVPLTSAPFKDYGSPDRPMTEEERTMLDRDLKVWHDQFIREVAENRNLSIEDVTTFANGASFPGQLALEMKLVDMLGDQESESEWFATELSIPKEEVVFCE